MTVESVWNHFQYSSPVYSETIRAGRRRIRRLWTGPPVHNASYATTVAGAVRVIVLY